MESKKQLPVPSPMAGKNKPVDWLFVFKFNAASFPGCTDDGKVPAIGTKGIFGGTVDAYKCGHSQQYVFATSASPTLVKGEGCVGATYNDPLGATFAQVYNNPGYYYVVWNDQFYNNPIESLDAPWGHSKGMVAWNEQGEGMVLQVSTPSWPASACCNCARQNDGNTLGCINDDDIEVAQHFFSVKLTKGDLANVLKALVNANVVTDITQPNIVHNGGPKDIQALVNKLPKKPSQTEPHSVHSHNVFRAKLSSGIELVSKPSSLCLPPWQMVSALLNGIDLRVASWWAEPEIYSTAQGQKPLCWSETLGNPGAVEIATSGNWNGTSFGLTGGDGQNFNHAKVGISKDKNMPLCIFGDMNQQGALAPNYAHANQTCSSSQNGRGGTFYILNNPTLFASLTAFFAGDSAPIRDNSGKEVATKTAVQEKKVTVS